MRENDFAYGVAIELFVERLWEEYINQRPSEGTYGDEVTLRAVANLYNVEIELEELF